MFGVKVRDNLVICNLSFHNKQMFVKNNPHIHNILRVASKYIPPTYLYMVWFRSWQTVFSTEKMKTFRVNLQ